LSSAYKLKHDDILQTLEQLLQSRKVNAREDEIAAGLAMARKGGDFADGVNAYNGRLMTSGASVFASFDKQAVRLLAEQGMATLIPA